MTLKEKIKEYVDDHYNIMRFIRMMLKLMVNYILMKNTYHTPRGYNLMLYTSVDKLTVSNQVYKFMCNLYPNLEKVDIEVIPTDLTEDNVFGWCLENNNQFEIEIHHKLGYFDFVTTLIHELVHVDQTLRGLFDDQKRENEAYVLEKKLGKKFMLENEPCKVS